jgi:hypothetical protein
MDISFVQPDLRRLDRLTSEALSIPFFEDERPLRGALGLVDWRMCGALSELILRGRIDGHAGEKLLVPARPRLPFEKLFLFGLGPMGEFDESTFDDSVDRMLETLTRARVRASVWVLPGRALGLMDPGAAVERFLEIITRHPEHDEVTLVEGSEDQKEIRPIVERSRRRARALTTA